MRTRFVFEVSPAIISTLLFETPKTFASTFTSFAFAAPSTGGAAMRTFRAPSRSPTISLLDARGATRTSRMRSFEAIGKYSVNETCDIIAANTW